jgi:hypothetical protein
MAIESMSSSGPSLWTWIAGWWQAKTRQREMDNLDPGVASNISRELGTSVGELRALAGKWPDSSRELLTRRLQALALDPAELARKEPATARDLAVHCTLCADQTRCRDDLDHNRADPAWRGYCVNTVTLTALKDERDRQAKKEKS